MFTTVEIEEIYQSNWNDSIIISVYENETCKNYDKAILFNPNASKKTLLRKICSLSDTTTDMVLLIDNIVNLTHIEAFKMQQKIILSTSTKTMTIHLSKQLITILEKMK